jgi:hypothetical protein
LAEHALVAERGDAYSIVTVGRHGKKRDQIPHHEILAKISVLGKAMSLNPDHPTMGFRSIWIAAVVSVDGSPGTVTSEIR